MNRIAHHSALVLPILLCSIALLAVPAGAEVPQELLDRVVNRTDVALPWIEISPDVRDLALASVTDTLGSEVEQTLPSPPPAPGGTTNGGMFYTRVKLPGPGYRVVVKFYHPSCAAVGGLCDTEIYVSGEDGYAWFPLTYPAGPFTAYWWSKVRIETPCITPWAWFDRALMDPIELMPENQPSHRLTDIVVSYPADEVLVCNEFRSVQSHSQQVFAWSRGSLQIRWGLKNQFNDSDYMEMTDLGQFFQYGAESGLYRMQSTMRHEYMHGLQRTIFPNGSECTRDGYGINDLASPECEDHDGCTTGQSYQGSFTEGLPYAYAYYMMDLLMGRAPGTNWPPLCWRQYPDDPAMKSDMREKNIAGYIYARLVANPRGTMDSYRYGRIAEVATGRVFPPTTALLLRSIIKNTNYFVDKLIAVPAPSTDANEDKHWRYNIFGQDTTVASPPDPTPIVTGVESPEFPTIEEYSDARWILTVGPNPVRGGGSRSISVRVIAPSSGAVRLSLFSVTGRRVCSQEYSGLSYGETTLSFRIPYLPTAAYFLKFEDSRWHRAEDSATIVVVR